MENKLTEQVCVCETDNWWNINFSDITSSCAGATDGVPQIGDCRT